MSLLAAFAASLLLLATLGSVIAAKLWSDQHLKKLLLWIPICLLAAVSTFKTIDGVMGWPSRHLPESFELLDYRSDGKVIYIWGVEKGSSVPRTWRTAYDKKLHEELEKGKQQVGQGKKVRLQRRGQGPDEVQRGQGDRSSEWVAHELFFQQHPLKPR
jgi:hypothetical protein